MMLRRLQGVLPRLYPVAQGQGLAPVQNILANTLCVEQPKSNSLFAELPADLSFLRGEPVLARSSAMHCMANFTVPSLSIPVGRVLNRGSVYTNWAATNHPCSQKPDSSHTVSTALNLLGQSRVACCFLRYA